MTNQECLEKYIAAFSVLTDRYAVLIGNLDLEFMFVSNYYLKLTGAGNVIGKLMKDTDHPGKEYASQLRKISQRVLATGKKVSFFAIYKFPHLAERSCLLYHSSPIINPINGEIVGLVAELEPINPNFMAQVFKLARPASVTMIKSDIPEEQAKLKVELTSREKEILFLLLFGYSYKEIAFRLSALYNKDISASTINTIIRRQLFSKLGAHSVSDLICKAASAEVITEIPDGILASQEGIFELNYS